MISRINKIIHCLFIILILILISAGCSNNSKKKDTGISELRKALQDLQLSIALVVSNKETSPRLAFIAKNNSKIDIPVPEFWDYPNSLEVLEPNAKRPRSLSGDSMIKEVVIKPSESKTWYLDTMELFELYKEEGLYRIKWKIYDAESPEILLLKEKEKIGN